MARGVELKPAVRLKIVEGRELGLTYQQLATRHGISKNTIIKTCRMAAKRIDGKSLPRSGAPRRLNEDARDAIYEIAMVEQTRISWQELTEFANFYSEYEVSQRTVKRLLADMNIHKWRCLRRPFLKPEHAEKRLKWAEDHAHFTQADWMRVKWSDECTIERGSGARQQWVFCRAGTDRLLPEKVHSRPCGKGVSQMFWAAFGDTMRTSLVTMQGDPAAPRGGVTARVYLQTLKDNLESVLQPGDIFMQDGAGIHRAGIELWVPTNEVPRGSVVVAYRGAELLGHDPSASTPSQLTAPWLKGSMTS